MRKFVKNMVKPRAAMLLLSLVLMRSGAELADFLLIESRQTFLESEQLCQAQGYDGLAVLSTPETYSLALRLTEYHRYLGFGERKLTVCQCRSRWTVCRLEPERCRRF
ncbi:hypothetical protein RRG08_017273 [Elysia crispata]|uniref:Uncharacterized protein n=1 Tax=Elysia crispata TaxID=231223 RepID=A0AAE0XQV3_9GAST|nr:hypothetical protein RRG08_017273 [Elysia crispata]